MRGILGMNIPVRTRGRCRPARHVKATFGEQLIWNLIFHSFYLQQNGEVEEEMFNNLT